MAWTPRDIKDQVVQYPNRFKINGVPGQIIEPDFGVVTEPGQEINREFLMPIERRLNMAGGWRLLQEYKVAGTYTWIAPDMYGDGRSYTIGAYIIGGGGGGGRRLNTGGAAMGGGSGFAKNIFVEVAPGQSYPTVVGSGGTSGVSGGSTSFAGYVVNGGSGGSISGGKDPVWGGQPSGARNGTPSTGYYTGNAPAMGQGVPRDSSAVYVSYIGPGEFLNIFNGKRYLAAGGSTDGTNRQLGAVLDDGLTSGSAVITTGNGGDATSPGSGGGGSYGYGPGGETPLGGKGADGAVMIYV